MKQYSYLKALYLSFYSRSLYRDVAQNWGAGVILYLLLVLTVCWSISMVPVQKGINRFYQEFSSKYVPQLPVLQFDKGKLITPENHPYLIIDPSTKETVAVIDTSGAYTNLHDASFQVLLTQDTLYSRDEKTGKVDVTPIPESWDYTLHPSELNQTIQKSFIGWIWVVLLPFAIFFGLIYRLVQSVIYALFGKLFSVLMGVPLHYSQILKLTIVTLTPVIVIGSALDWFIPAFHPRWWFFFILAMGYLLFAISSNKDSTQTRD